MIDLNDVIEGLKELREYTDSEIHQIVSPDNWSVYSRLRDLIDETDNKALALLKAQEPRVMTLDEVLNAEDFVWAEIWTPGDKRWCLIYARINKSIYDDILMLHEDSGFGWTRLASNYNMKSGWRCWSARPTEEQRKNTPWEGDKE